MAGGRTGSPLGFGWESIARMRRGTEKTKVSIKSLEKTFIYWLGDEEGGALTKKAANHLSDYLKSRIWSQEGFIGMPALSPSWEDKKKELGLDLRTGIATEQMINAIRPVDQGGGLWRVGISGRDHVVTMIGNEGNIAAYAHMLEFGTSRGQPPRPVFSTSFLKWAKEELPEVIYNSLYRQMNKDLMDIYKVMGEYMPRYAPEDVIGQKARDQSTGEVDVASEAGRSIEDELISRESASDEPDYDFDDGGAEEEEKDPFGYDEAERTEEYTTLDQGKVVMHIIDATGEMWNWIDQKWQNMETAIARLQMYGEM